jgi:hypothetical protein
MKILHYNTCKQRTLVHSASLDSALFQVDTCTAVLFPRCLDALLILLLQNIK